MNIKKLKKGMEFNSYKHLAETLEIKSTGGNYKIKKLEELENFVDFEKKGNKFIIKEVYNENEIIKKEVERGRKSIYTKLIEILIMDSIPKKNKSIVFSKTKLIHDLGLINENYKIGINNNSLIADNLDMDVRYVDDFYKINNSNLNKIVNTSLDSLERKSLIFKSNVMMISYIGKKNPIIATEQQINDILEIEYEVLKAFNLKLDSNINYLLHSPNYYKFKNKLKKMLKEKLNIEYYYRATKLIVNHKYIEQEKIDLTNYVLEEMERLNKKEELNNIYSDNLMKNAKKRIDKNKDLQSIRSDSEYINNFKKLVDKLIKPNQITIRLQNEIDENYLLIDESQLPF